MTEAYKHAVSAEGWWQSGHSKRATGTANSMNGQRERATGTANSIALSGLFFGECMQRPTRR